VDRIDKRPAAFVGFLELHKKSQNQSQKPNAGKFYDQFIEQGSVCKPSLALDVKLAAYVLSRSAL
jgi:hypothetical protein